jgi:hypothetical protein
MEKETINNIFEFIKKNDNKNKPLRWKLINNEPFTEEELNVKGGLNLQFSKITSLPEGLKVERVLDLRKSKIKSLPEGLEVGGLLNLTYTEITSLPNDLDVKRSIFLKYCHKLKSLPQGLKVGGHLDISGTKLAKFSDNEIFEMIKPGFIKGKINR